ncbi:MAG: NYN domain-containing protein, partial [Candidatus Binatia bacterium]|nr:NYN domain-containing protein [Candidatus Binatia bacterium]
MASAKAQSDSKQVVAFVDGSNLFGGMAEILKPGEYFDFADFVGQLERDCSLEKIYFYGTYVRHLSTDSKTKQTLTLTQRRFFDSAKKHPKVVFYQGHFSKTTGKEKGVDVHLAIDMAVGAATSQYDEAIIITGD